MQPFRPHKGPANQTLSGAAQRSHYATLCSHKKAPLSHLTTFVRRSEAQL